MTSPKAVSVILHTFLSLIIKVVPLSSGYILFILKRFYGSATRDNYADDETALYDQGWVVYRRVLHCIAEKDGRIDPDRLKRE